MEPSSLSLHQFPEQRDAGFWSPLFSAAVFHLKWVYSSVVNVFPTEGVARERGAAAAAATATAAATSALTTHPAPRAGSPEDAFSNPTNDVHRPTDGYQPHKYPQTPRSIFIVSGAAVLYFLPPLSTTHTVHSKTKIHNIDRPVSPQLFFWNSHWKQITSALRFHPIAPGEQCSLACPSHPIPTPP